MFYLTFYWILNKKNLLLNVENCNTKNWYLRVLSLHFVPCWNMCSWINVWINTCERFQWLGGVQQEPLSNGYWIEYLNTTVEHNFYFGSAVKTEVEEHYILVCNHSVTYGFKTSF